MIKCMIFYVFFLTCLSYGETAVPMNYSHHGDDITLSGQVDADGTAVPYNTTSAYDLVEESEYASNYWDCSTQDEELKQKNLVEIGEMLQKGEEKLEKTKRHVPDVVLVLGNAGVGKTTLVQFMAGDNSKLISKEVGKGTGEYLIEDGIKIGSSATESQTLFPELVTNKSDGITYCDTPGFSDTRSPNHAVLATYLMRTYLKNFDRIKIILMVSYNSVQLGGYKDDFMNLLRNLNYFIKNNYDNYKNNILLVAAKVPNNYIVTGKNNVTLVSDENIISSIVEYIDEVKKSIEGKFNKVLDKEEKEFLSNSLKILDCLKVEDKNGKYKKINLFRRPSKIGPLNAISLLQNNKMSLKSTIQNGAEYTKLHDDDIGYTLSDAAKNHLDCLLQYINDKITKISKNIFEEYIKPLYRTKIDNSHDVYELVSELKMTDVELDKLKNDLDNSKNVTGYITTLSTFLADKNITNQNGSNFKNYEDEFKEVTTYISKAEQFSDIKHTLKPISWTAEIEPLKMMIKDSITWNDITIKLFEHFSTFKVQKSLKKYANEMPFNQLNASNNEKNSIYKFMLSSSNFLSDHDINNYFNQVSLNDQKVKDLEEMISVTLNIPINITCNNQGKLTVSGNFIKVSEINKKQIIKDYCGDYKLKVLILKAVQTIFIDDNLNDDIFKGIDVIMIAPRWEVIGARIIKLDGKDGNQQTELAMGNTDGLPVLPGGNGGILNNNFPSAQSMGSETDDLEELTDGGDENDDIPPDPFPVPRPPIGTKPDGLPGLASTERNDGLSGLPGKNGGIFLGIGMNFINGISLKITSNGGNGGPGQNGKNGRKGRDGENGSKWIKKAIYGTNNGKCSITTWETGSKSYSTALSEVFLNDDFDSEAKKKLIYHHRTTTSSTLLPPLFHGMELQSVHAKLSVYTCNGEEGSKGENGGHGAVGGFGGHEGSIRLVELEQSSQIQSENKRGNPGTPGNGGKGGEGGGNGSGSSCYRITLFHYSYSRIEEEYWRCREDAASKNKLNMKGADGISNHSTIGLLNPMKPEKELNYSTDVLEYVLDLQKMRKNKFLSKLISKFRSKLIKQWFEINYKSLWRLIVAQDSLEP